MQIESLTKIFDTTELTVQHPLSPEGFLFTYYPSENPAGVHYHNFMEIGYCESGTGLFIVDGEIIPFNGKCVSIIYEGQVHIAKSISPEKSLWHFLYIDLDKLFFNANPTQLSALKHSEYLSYTFPNIIHYQDDPTLYHLVSAIMSESAACRENYLAAVQGLVLALLVDHGRYMQKAAPCENPEEKTFLLSELAETLTYISRHYTESVTVEELCAVSNMSKSTLQRKMSACVGYAPLQYIQRLRMSHAAVLLQDKTIPIAEVATRSGYNSISSFNRCFLSHYGVSPSQWRSGNDAIGDKPQQDRETKI